MIQVCSVIEPCQFEKRWILLDIFQTAESIYFIDHGKVGIGFEMNKKKQISQIKQDFCLVGLYTMI